MLEDIRRSLLGIPSASGWPDLVSLLERPVKGLEEFPSYRYPILASEAVGGGKEKAIPGAAAVFCLHLSIHLVDDLLDEDPKGLYHTLGAGSAANLALALQALASAVVSEADLSDSCRAAVHETIAGIALATAYGQSRDAGTMSGEEDYWQAVETKTPPLFGGALKIGALLGGAPAALSREIERCGLTLGRMVQVSDDLKDAMEEEACPDWRSRYNNLPILYAMTADHPRRERFLALLPRVEDPKALKEAQEILVSSGAMSFCAYHITKNFLDARKHVTELELTDHSALFLLLDHLFVPTKNILERFGMETPVEIG